MPCDALKRTTLRFVILVLQWRDNMGWHSYWNGGVKVTWDLSDLWNSLCILPHHLRYVSCRKLCPDGFVLKLSIKLNKSTTSGFSRDSWHRYEHQSTVGVRRIGPIFSWKLMFIKAGIETLPKRVHLEAIYQPVRVFLMGTIEDFWGVAVSGRKWRW